MLKRLLPLLVALTSLNAASANIKVLAPEAITNLVNTNFSVNFGGISVKTFGAVGNGLVDDSQAFYDALDAAAGKTIYVPPGTYAINLVLNYIYSSTVLRGNSGPSATYPAATRTLLIPWDRTKPIIKILDNSYPVSGLTIENFDFSGDRSGVATSGTIGLEVSGGSYGCFFRNLSFKRFYDYGLKISNGTLPNYFNHYENIELAAHTGTCNANGAALGMIYNSGSIEFITSQYFNNIDLHGDNKQWNVIIDGTSGDFMQGWWQCYDGKGLMLTNNAKARLNQIIFDSNNAYDELITLNQSTPSAAIWALDGDFQVDGFIKTGATNITASVVLTNGANILWSSVGAFGTNNVKYAYAVSGNGIPTGAFVGIGGTTNYLFLTDAYGNATNATSSSTETLTFKPMINGGGKRSFRYSPVMYAPTIAYNMLFVDDSTFAGNNPNVTSPYIGASSGNLVINAATNNLYLQAPSGVYVQNAGTFDLSTSTTLYPHGGVILDNAKKIYFKTSTGANADVLFSSSDTMYVNIATNWTGGLYFYDPQATYTNSIKTGLNIIPVVNMTNDLGSATKSWRRIYNERYDDLPPRQLQVGSTAPATSATFRDLVQTYQFSGTASNQVYLSWQMPHSWKEGSSVIPHIHYSPQTITANSNTVWQLEYTWQNINGTFGATTSSQITNAFIPVQYSHNLAAFPTISGAGKTISSILVCRLVRRPEDGGDDYVNQVNLLDVDLHILCDTMGSLTDTAK